MSIVKEELPPEKKIVISKVDFSCDIIDKSIPKPLFQNYNSFLILSAPPRSGKSTWIQNCLCKNGKAKILYNRRHITANGGDEANGVTVWVTTQSYNRIPLMIRKVANGIIAFKLKNVKEIMSIYDEFVIGLSKDQFMDILKYVFKKNYDFLFMNFDKPWDEVYHKNFNQLVLDV